MHRLVDLALAVGAEQAFDAGDHVVDPLRVLGQGGAEGVEIADRVVQRTFALGKEIIDLAQHFARALGHVLGCARIGDEERRPAVLGERQGRGPGRAALERDRGDPGQPLEIQADARVRPHRRLRLDRNRRHHLAGIGGVELQVGDLADANAVEQHRGSGAQPRHGAVEHHPIGVAHAVVAEVREPIDEPERGGDDGERERADQHVIGSGFHPTPSLPYAAPAARAGPANRPRCPWK